MNNPFQLSPAARKRLFRFRRYRRAYISAWLLAIVFALALCADLICNDKPLFVRADGQNYFPCLRYYAESEFIEGGRTTRPDYKALNGSPLFEENAHNFMIFAPIPFGARETLSEESLQAEGRVVVTYLPIPRAGSVNVNEFLTIARSRSAARFFMQASEAKLRGVPFDSVWPVSPNLRRAVEARFKNQPAPALRQTLTATSSSDLHAELSLSAYSPRSRNPSTVRIILRTPEASAQTAHSMVLNKELSPTGAIPALWSAITPDDKERIQQSAVACRQNAVNPIMIHVNGQEFQALFDNSIAWPHPPIRGHWLGIDSAGRDVLARIVHGLRVSLVFSVLLVISSMSVGIIVGAIQGFYGGYVDIAGQRLIEVWSAIPFLYVMILLGSIYGASFWLLLVCYAIFNWIGISYYMRAEFLRLRKQPFVDAARVLGISSRRIIFRHILPNAITPIITFLPFYLVGAIASLAALDYLGFGLPALTPSLGQLLHQAQANRSAWWLILYPSLALLIVMLLGVFVGEGVREAYDPRPRTKME
jgi:microcin C transport system permease protein